MGKRGREEVDGRKQPFGSTSVSMTRGSIWGLGSRGRMVALCPAALGLWTGHPVKWTICFLKDQDKGPWSQPCLGLAHSRASLSSRALDPSAARPSTAPKLPQSVFVNGPSIHLTAQAKCLGITLGSPVSLTPHIQAISEFPSPKYLWVGLLPTSSAPNSGPSPPPVIHAA